MKKVKKKIKAKKKRVVRVQSHRWYDRMPTLAIALDALRTTSPASRDKSIREILCMVKSENPDLLDKFVLQFPLNLYRRRWYDKDPYLWLIFNGLRFADDELLGKIAAFFDRKKKQ